MKRKIKSSYIIVLIIVVFIVCFRAYRHRLIKLPNAVPISITVIRGNCKSLEISICPKGAIHYPKKRS